MAVSRSFGLVALLLFIAGCEEPPPPVEAAIVDETSGETLMATPPAGWTEIYQLNDEKTRLRDYVPAGQTDLNWSLKVSFESFANLTGSDPISILLAEAEKDAQKCESVRHDNLFSGYENNYPTSVRLYECTRNVYMDKGEIKMIKAIQGQEYFYMVRILARIAPFKAGQPDFSDEEIVRWTGFLRRVSLCNEANPDHPCPQDGRPNVDPPRQG